MVSVRAGIFLVEKIIAKEAKCNELLKRMTMYNDNIALICVENN